MHEICVFVQFLREFYYLVSGLIQKNTESNITNNYCKSFTSNIITSYILLLQKVTSYVT